MRKRNTFREEFEVSPLGSFIVEPIFELEMRVSLTPGILSRMHPLGTNIEILVALKGLAGSNLSSLTH